VNCRLSDLQYALPSFGDALALGSAILSGPDETSTPPSAKTSAPPRDTNGLGPSSWRTRIRRSDHAAAASIQAPRPPGENPCFRASCTRCSSSSLFIVYRRISCGSFFAARYGRWRSFASPPPILAHSCSSYMTAAERKIWVSSFLVQRRQRRPYPGSPNRPDIRFLSTCV